MERCNTCKWWGELRTYLPNLRSCKHPKIAEDDGQDFGTDGMAYPYSEGTGMFTGPDFGCVHHTTDWSADWCKCDNSSDLNMIGLDNVVGWVRCSDCGRIKPGELPKNRPVNPAQ